MRATSRLVTRASLQHNNSFSRPLNLLLPRQSWWDVMSASVQGLWSQVRSPTAREIFEDAVRKNIIKDTVLAQATHGSVLTMALFQNLQNPLFEQCQFNAEEFVDAVGPALEQFHEVLMKLGNELPDVLATKFNQQKENSDSDTPPDDGQQNHIPPIFRLDENFIKETLLGPNIWREHADQNPDSLAGRLAKMTTADALDAFFYSAKLVLLGTPSTTHRITVTDCKVGEVALLNARAIRMNPPLTIEGDENDTAETKSTDTGGDSIAAQMDVLYEVTHTYKQPITKDPLSLSESYKNFVVGDIDTNSTMEGKDNSTNTDEKDSATTTTTTTTIDSNSTETIEYETILTTTLGVAILEGWLQGGPNNNNGLRWKVALVRDANEFPHQPSITKITK